MAQYGVQSLVLSVLMLGEVDQICCDVIGVIIIISVLRSIQAVGANLLVADKVCLQCIIEFLQRVLLVIKYELLDRCH